MNRVSDKISYLNDVLQIKQFNLDKFNILILKEFTEFDRGTDISLLFSRH